MEWTEIEREQFGVGFVLRVGVVVVLRGLFSSIQCFGIEVSQSGRRKEGKLWCREWNCCWALVLVRKILWTRWMGVVINLGWAMGCG